MTGDGTADGTTADRAAADGTAYRPDRTISVPVAGGTSTVGVWGDGGPVTLLIHGITASHRSWVLVAEALRGHGTLVAPDLRGRGDSGTLPGPYGMSRHAADCVAALDAVGASEPVTVVGHSMGGFVAVVLAHQYPRRVRDLVLVDGGVPLPMPPGNTVEERITAVIGPAAARLAMRFADVAEHREFWKRHPALAEWHPAIESYVDYDLTGEPPELHSKVATEAMIGDSQDMLEGTALAEAWAGLAHPGVLLRAERGLLDQVPPLYPDPAPIAERLPVRDVAANHYTISLSESGAACVAEAVRTPPSG